MAKPIKVNKIAKKLVKANPKLEAVVKKNEGKSYKAVSTIIKANITSISENYAKGAYITKSDVHNLTWAVVNVVSGESKAGGLELI